MTGEEGLRHAGATVLVTGGSRNIGLAICERMAREGATVIVNGVVPGEPGRVAEELRRAGYPAHGIEADISDEASVAALFHEIADRYGTLDVLVNNAAVPMVGRVPIAELSLKDWDQVFAVNARGSFLCTMHALPLMTGPSPSIVNISSIGATKAHRSAVAYDATKGAIEAFTRAAALELAPRGIRVNAVAPGAIANDWYESRSAEIRRAETSAIPLGRVGTGADVAAATSMLASADASYITGHVLAVDGGLSVQARQPTSEVTISEESIPGRQGGSGNGS